ncbi:hypothetical protein ABH922_002988 [Rhodococcus sp. 27YEA15]|uniref:hypothetical protein n=1 Tax=Rhodococcus sp. 27YEA15 TaxID=3156259 RepID=UPI003C7A4F0C
MASTASNVLTAEPLVSGVVFRNRLGAPAPGPAGSALTADWGDHGYVGEDGITESETRDTTEKNAFGGAVVKILQTKYGLVFKFKLMESKNATVLKTVFGESNVNIAGNVITVNKNKKTLPHSSWVIDTVDEDTNVRNYIPDGQPKLVGDRVYVHTDTISYEVEITSFELAGNNAVMTISSADGSVTKVLTLPAGSTAGTWNVYVDGETTAGIAFNPTAAAVKSALEALPTVGAGNVDVTGSTGGPFTVVFKNGAGVVTASGSGLTPSGTVTVA